ncbi:MAG: hypothetical protein CML06_14920 [Pseudomonadales bacterium]|nr:hypothetical protein [Pseudomonadales bacterium]
MSSVTIIEKAIKSGVLIEGLAVIPDKGATNEEITQEESRLPRRLSDQHKALLRRWNGMNMDVMRLYGCANVHPELRQLSDAQTDMFTGVCNYIVFGDDPSGFMYAEGDDGVIYSVQVSTGNVKELASSLDDFFERLVFGKDAKDFGGTDWEEELRDVGLL